MDTTLHPIAFHFQVPICIGITHYLRPLWRWTWGLLFICVCPAREEIVCSGCRPCVTPAGYYTTRQYPKAFLLTITNISACNAVVWCFVSPKTLCILVFTIVPVCELPLWDQISILWSIAVSLAYQHCWLGFCLNSRICQHSVKVCTNAWTQNGRLQSDITN